MDEFEIFRARAYGKHVDAVFDDRAPPSTATHFDGEVFFDDGPNGKGGGDGDGQFRKNSIQSSTLNASPPVRTGRRHSRGVFPSDGGGERPSSKSPSSSARDRNGSSGGSGTGGGEWGDSSRRNLNVYQVTVAIEPPSPTEQSRHEVHQRSKSWKDRQSRKNYYYDDDNDDGCGGESVGGRKMRQFHRTRTVPNKRPPPPSSAFRSPPEAVRIQLPQGDDDEDDDDDDDDDDWQAKQRQPPTHHQIRSQNRLENDDIRFDSRSAAAANLKQQQQAPGKTMNGDYGPPLASGNDAGGPIHRPGKPPNAGSVKRKNSAAKVKVTLNKGGDVTSSTVAASSSSSATGAGGPVGGRGSGSVSNSSSRPDNLHLAAPNFARRRSSSCTPVRGALLQSSLSAGQPSPNTLRRNSCTGALTLKPCSPQTGGGLGDGFSTGRRNSAITYLTEPRQSPCSKPSSRRNSGCGSETGSSRRVSRCAAPGGGLDADQLRHILQASVAGKASCSDGGETTGSGDEEPATWRVLVLGGHGVGKTTLTHQLQTSEYLANKDTYPGKTAVVKKNSYLISIDIILM